MSHNPDFQFGEQCQCCGEKFHSNEELLDHIDYFQDLAAFHQAAADRARMHILSRRKNDNKVGGRVQYDANVHGDDEMSYDSSCDSHDYDYDVNNNDATDVDNGNGDGDDDGGSKKTSNMRKLQCHKCKAKSTTRQNAQRHFQQHVSVNVICRHCLEPFGWANRYLSHKCIREMRDPMVDFQASRIVRKVRRSWERSQRGRSGASAIGKDSIHRKRRRTSPASTKNESERGNNRNFRANDAYQWPDGIMAYGKEVDCHQDFAAISNNPDDDGMWFRGNMFRRPHFESSGIWVGASTGAISEMVSHQEPYSQYVGSALTIPGNREMISESISSHWEPPAQLPGGNVAVLETSAILPEPPLGRWDQSGQSLSGSVTNFGGRDVTGEVPIIGTLREGA